MSFVTFVQRSLCPKGNNASKDEGHQHLTFCVVLFLIHSIWEQVPNRRVVGRPLCLAGLLGGELVGRSASQGCSSTKSYSIGWWVVIRTLLGFLWAPGSRAPDTSSERYRWLVGHMDRGFFFPISFVSICSHIHGFLLRWTHAKSHRGKPMCSFWYDQLIYLIYIRIYVSHS
jgi:hypothetical protein